MIDVDPEKLERELRALVPVLVVNAARDRMEPAHLADRVVRVVMTCLVTGGTGERQDDY